MNALDEAIAATTDAARVRLIDRMLASPKSRSRQEQDFLLDRRLHFAALIPAAQEVSR